MPGKRIKKSAKGAKKPATKRAVAKAAEPRKQGRAAAAQPVLLSGGNPQIAKGDAPVRAYLAAMPG